MKIEELSNRKDEADLLWVLACTAPISTQLADPLREKAAKDGIEILTIDWTGDPPLLAVVLAKAGTPVIDKVEALSGEIKKNELEEIFVTIREQEGFQVQVKKILRHLNAPEVATIRAAEKNRKWFADRFSDTHKARLDLGQPLAPNAVEVSHGKRDDLISCAVAQLQSGEPVVLLGDEGSGKSWLAAKVIEQQEAHTLTALFSAEQLPDRVESGQAVDLLAKQLIRQTDGDPNDGTLLKRWCRRINAWGDRIRPGRFLIVLDGLNQGPRKNRGRIIEVFRQLSKKAGGQLLVTCRSHYFETQIKGRLSGPIEQIIVPEWTAQERDDLLKRSGVDPTTLDQQAARSLFNPRLLGIALQLLPPDDRDAWQGLTVERLLFEHIWASARDNDDYETAQDFADRLTDHAQQILDRVQSQQREDLLIFENQAGAVAEGRFFIPVAGPKNAYELRQEGLSLALGFALVDQLLHAQRNNKDLSESVSRTLEPIATLDDTAKVVLAALTAITMNESWFKQEIHKALIDGFVFLQNPNPDHYPAFVRLAKERVTEFLNAAETLTLQETPYPNSDWIKSTLFYLRDDKESWPLVESTVTQWLSYYTLDPEQQILPNDHLSVDERQETIKKKRSEIKTRLNSLSEAERQILGEMREIPKDPTRLTDLAIPLLAGLKLAPFARALVRASLSKALNGGIYWPYEQFRHLLSFNSHDWVKARKALLNESSVFRAENSSSTGKWALVTILGSTGDDDDEREASTLAETLREPRPWPQSWRHIEGYCSVDPCDPESKKPDNVVNTATKYQQIDVTQLHLNLWCTGEGDFLEDALPAIARFYPEIAAEKHVQLIGQLPVRSGLPLRQVAVQDSQHRPLIDRDTALRLVDILRNPSALADLSKKERRIVSSLLSLFAFPLLTGPEQLEAMRLIPNPENYFLSLCPSMKSFNEALFECKLQTAVAQDNRTLISILLAFAKHSETPLTSEVCRIIGSLVRHEIESIRADAFGTIYRRELSDLLPAVLESGYCYTAIKDKDSREARCGSLVLIYAAKQGIADLITVLDRIMPGSFGVAARELGPEATKEIAHRLLVRENRNFRLLEKFSLEAFTAFYKAVPEALIDLADSFLSYDSEELSYIHNVPLLTAYAISKDEPEKAKFLFKKVEDSNPSLRVTVWKSAANPLIDELRCSRLDRAVTDHELATEVLAAEQAGRHDVLDAYIEAKCSSDTPAIVARGLMVAGFCDDRQEPGRVLADHAGRVGLIGTAHSAAEYAFERNRWARHWYQKMSETENPVQYWINKCLFAKVVDGRFYLWKRQTSDRSSPLFVYHEITEKAVKDRCEKWKRKREKNLFGQDAPEPLFIQS
ncbi:MAG: hypothetical protein OXI72_19550 [Gemmatimonadota bacterium]|nr:hypothetical protein [Gemmatimonadota bacterium]